MDNLGLALDKLYGLQVDIIVSQHDLFNNTETFVDSAGSELLNKAISEELEFIRGEVSQITKLLEDMLDGT